MRPKLEDMKTESARRARRAAMIIREAYGFHRDTLARRAVRYELLGSDVALVVLRDQQDAPVQLRVARLDPDGRARQLRRHNRRGFASVREQIDYFDKLYAEFGSPQSTSPRTATTQLRDVPTPRRRNVSTASKS
jgi:hypothetical protein